MNIFTLAGYPGSVAIIAVPSELSAKELNDTIKMIVDDACSKALDRIDELSQLASELGIDDIEDTEQVRNVARFLDGYESRCDIDDFVIEKYRPTGISLVGGITMYKIRQVRG